MWPGNEASEACWEAESTKLRVAILMTQYYDLRVILSCLSVCPSCTVLPLTRPQSILHALCNAYVALCSNEMEDTPLTDQQVSSTVVYTIVYSRLL